MVGFLPGVIEIFSPCNDFIRPNFLFRLFFIQKIVQEDENLRVQKANFRKC